MQAEIITIGAGDLLLGVRTSDPAVTARLKVLLGRHLVNGFVAPPNLSLGLGAGKGAIRGIHLLYRSATRELRTGSLGRILRAIPRQLDGYLPPPPGVARLNARALVGPDDAVLIDRRFDTTLEPVEPRLAAKGYRRSDFALADVDVETGELRLTHPSVSFDADAAAALDAEFPLDKRELPDKEMRMPVRQLLTAVPSLQWDTLDTQAERAMALAPVLADRRRRVAPGALAVVARWLAEGRVDLRSYVNEADLLAIADQRVR